jgi:hypothetical protein
MYVKKWLGTAKYWQYYYHTVLGQQCDSVVHVAGPPAEFSYTLLQCIS